jgi:type I restriction enzyme S subunit
MAIELNNQINKTLEEMTQAIFKSWFVDFEPFKDGEFEESELGLIPKGWRVGILRDICNINMGQSPPSDTYNDIGIGMVFFQGIKDFGFKYPEETVYCSKPNKIAKPGDVLLSVRAPVGEINVAYKECCIGRGISSLKLKNHKNNILYYWLKTIKNQFHDVSNGSIFDAINKSGIESIKVIVPTAEIIDIFNKLIEPIDEEIFNNFQTTKALKNIRDTLLPKLMTGEIRVPVEEVV